MGSFTNLTFKTSLESQIDEDYSSYFSAAQVNVFAQKALMNVLQRHIDLFQKSKRLSENLRPITVKTTLTSVSTPPVTSNTIDLTNATLNYYELISMRAKFTGNTTNWRVCEPLYFVERGDPFSEGTERNPVYFRANNVMNIEPTTPAITSLEFIYFKLPLTADGTQIDTSVASYTLKWNDKMVQEILDATAKAMAIDMRDRELYAMAQQQELENGTK